MGCEGPGMYDNQVDLVLSSLLPPIQYSQFMNGRLASEEARFLMRKF